MAAIQNDRDILLQAASPRVIPPLIPIEQIDGLPAAIKRLVINASATTFIGSSGTTSPASITLTAERQGGLVGSVVWSVTAGSGTLTPSGDTATISGSTVSGQSITLRARVTEDATNFDAFITLTKLGTLSGQAAVNLATQITGQLANSNVSGLKALALLDSVSLSNPVQVVGDLAASRIGVGTLAAGVIYAGTVNVDNLVGTTISGKNISGSDLVYIGGGTSLSPISLRGSGGSGPGPYPYTGDARVYGYFRSEYSGSGGVIENGSAGPRITGNTVISGNDVDVTASTLTLSASSTLNITGATSFSGSLGSRIILKGVTYNATVNGTPGTTVLFS